MQSIDILDLQANHHGRNPVFAYAKTILSKASNLFSISRTSLIKYFITITLAHLQKVSTQKTLSQKNNSTCLIRFNKNQTSTRRKK